MWQQRFVVVLVHDDLIVPTGSTADGRAHKLVELMSVVDAQVAIWLAACPCAAVAAAVA